MATSKTDVSPDSKTASDAVAVAVAVGKPKKEGLGLIGNVIDSVLRLLSSVRFGLIMLGTLLACCMTGMLIMQVNVEGFQPYYNALSPASRVVFGRLGLFDIYNSWYFSLLLAVTGLNIILASIDRFPTAWQYISNP